MMMNDDDCLNTVTGFQGLLFDANKTIWTTDNTLTGTTSPRLGGPESNSNGGVLYIPQIPELEPHH